MCCGLTWAREALRSYVPICRFGITPSGEAEAQHPSLLTSSACPNTTREVTRENFSLSSLRSAASASLSEQKLCLCHGIAKGSKPARAVQSRWLVGAPVSTTPSHFFSSCACSPPLGLGNSRGRKESDRRANHSPQPRQITAVKEKRHHQF